MTYTLTGLNSMGTLSDEQHTMDSGLFEMPMPASPSSAKILLDMFGCSRNIVLKGTFSSDNFSAPPASYSTIADFIVALDALQNGAQTQKVYHSDKTNQNYNVLVTGASWTAEPGATNSVTYEINLVEGTT